MPIDYVAVGKRIRELRRKQGITQLELSEMINVSPPHMSNIENGNKNVGVETLVKIANVLHISTDELLEDNLACMTRALEKMATGRLTSAAWSFSDGYVSWMTRKRS